jgi:hypothetical protein
LESWNDPRDRIPSEEDLGFLHRIDRLVMFRWFVAAYLVVHIALRSIRPDDPSILKAANEFLLPCLLIPMTYGFWLLLG